MPLAASLCLTSLLMLPVLLIILSNLHVGYVEPHGGGKVGEHEEEEGGVRHQVLGAGGGHHSLHEQGQACPSHKPRNPNPNPNCDWRTQHKSFILLGPRK
jgi:hypothetical protein